MTLSILIACIAIVYAASSIVMVLFIPHHLAAWTLSCRYRKAPSFFTRWSSVFVSRTGAQFATSYPTNSDKLAFLAVALCPVVNTVELAFLVCASVVEGIRRLSVWAFFGDQEACNRWMNAR